MTYRVPNKRPPHGGFWWIFVGWWWWLFIGWWWKPLKGMFFSGPAAVARNSHNKGIAKEEQAAMTAAMTAAALAAQQQATPTGPPPGWYQVATDPAGTLRWWDGTKYTEHTQAPGVTPPPA